MRRAAKSVGSGCPLACALSRAIWWFMSAGTNCTRLPAARAARSSSRAISPPPMPTTASLLATMAADVGASRFEPGRRPPQVASRTKNTWSTQGDSASPPSRASDETMPSVAKPRARASAYTSPMPTAVPPMLTSVRAGSCAASTCSAAARIAAGSS